MTHICAGKIHVIDAAVLASATSALVERLFGLGRQMYVPHRNILIANFERQLLLRANKKFCNLSLLRITLDVLPLVF